jgi:hypothetical protein
LANWKGFAAGYTELKLHQVQACDAFGDRMLDLDAGIHLQKERGTGLVQHKLNRTCAYVINRLRGPHSMVQQIRTTLLATLAIKSRAWGLLDHFLMPSLNRALSLPQMNAVAMLIGENLDLHMPGPGQVPLKDHPVLTEGCSGDPPSLTEGSGEFPFRLNNLHALSTTTCTRLDDDRPAYFCSSSSQSSVRLVVPVVSW